jgi:DNA transformation protein
VAAGEEFARIEELFSAFGPVRVRRMFGGAGVYAAGVMFALVADGVVYLKADATTIPAFEREGAAAFSYATRDGPRRVMSYWRLPERLYDDPEALAAWAAEALAAARRYRDGGVAPRGARSAPRASRRRRR